MDGQEVLKVQLYLGNLAVKSQRTRIQYVDEGLPSGVHCIYLHKASYTAPMAAAT